MSTMAMRSIAVCMIVHKFLNHRQFIFNAGIRTRGLQGGGGTSAPHSLPNNYVWPNRMAQFK